MSDSYPELNPYASPAEIDTAADESLSDSKPRPAVRPRWWEILIFAVLLPGYVGYSIYSLAWMFDALDFSNWEMVRFVSISLMQRTLAVVTFVGGIIALRLWSWRMLPDGLAPGHLLLLTKFLSLGVYLAVVLVSGILVVAMGSDLTTVLLTVQIIGPLVPLVLLLLMLPRFGDWFWAAAVGLAVAAVAGLMQALFLFGDYFAGPNYRPNLLGEWTTISVIGGLLAAIVLVVVAVREVKQGIRRDWLHWTGIACWLGAILLPLMTMIL